MTLEWGRALFRTVQRLQSHALGVLGMQQRLDGRLWFQRTACSRCLLWQIDKGGCKFSALHLRVEMLAEVVWHSSAGVMCIRPASCHCPAADMGFAYARS